MKKSVTITNHLSKALRWTPPLPGINCRCEPPLRGNLVFIRLPFLPPRI
jgi:hypothetical protein